MLSADHNLEIDAPAELVWEVITDFPHYGEWNPFCLECTSTLKPGDTINMRVNLGRAPQKVVEIIESCVPGKGFSYHMKPLPLGALRSLRSHAIEACGADKSQYRSHFELSGWLLPLVAAMFGEGMQSGFEQMSAGVKQRAEDLWRQRQR